MKTEVKNHYRLNGFLCTDDSKELAVMALSKTISDAVLKIEAKDVKNFNRNLKVPVARVVSDISEYCVIDVDEINTCVKGFIEAKSTAMDPFFKTTNYDGPYDLFMEIDPNFAKTYLCKITQDNFDKFVEIYDVFKHSIEIS